MPIEQCYRKFSDHTSFTPGIKKSAKQTSFYACLPKVFLNKLHWGFAITILLWLPASGQTTIISATGNGGFETGTTFAANGWTSVNGPFNQWYVGTAGGFFGARAAFIGTNSSTYAYNNLVSSINHFYTDVTIPANLPNLTLSFKVKVVGNANCTMTVFFAPAGTAVTAGTAISLLYTVPGEPVGGYNTSYGSYTTITLPFTGTGTHRLIFSWRNNASNNQPPAAVDDISLVASGCSAYSGTGYVSVPSLPYTSTARNTCGKVNDYTSGNSFSCGAAGFLGGEDEIFEFKPTATGALTITMSNASSTASSMMLYQGCPYNPSYGVTSCVAYNQNSTTSKLICANVMLDSSYFILVDAVSGCYTYDISITAPGSSVPNDLPCGATAITLGTMVMDDNTCATGTGEPGTPGCWNVGNLNSLWYSFVAPSSGQVHVGTLTQSLTTAQIELFSGTCGSLTSVAGSCNNYSTMRCPGATYTGLTSGSTYYIRLDGLFNDAGSFGISVDNNAGTLTPMSGDCNGAVEVCSNVYNSPANSYGCGNVADISGYPTVSNPTNPNCCNAGCLQIGETNPRWYRLNINTSGSLRFTLNGGVISCYDFSLWNITGSSCGAIAGNTLAPVRCNWNVPCDGMDGMENPIPMGGQPGNFESPLPVTAGETYILCITNYSVSTTNYTLSFANSTCTFGGTTSTWNGYGGTSWTTTGSWSGCQGVPSCSINAVVNPAASQPVISASATVRDLTINSGSTLTLNAGVILTVCGNFTNNGTLNISPSATILFSGTATQSLSGTLTGTNKLGNVTITKTSGSVIANADVDVGGTFTTSNNTSIFDANGKYIKLAGHFSNASGSTTFTNVGTGTLEFNGAANQNYSPGGTLTLKNVRMNQSTTSTVTLVGYNMTFSGTLTLTNGRISTGSSYEVTATSSLTGSVTAGNVNSYVDGYLRRSVNPTGSYDFPVGDFASGKGYQRANINFTSSSNVTNLLAKFQPYSSVPAALGVLDCGNTYNMPALDNGYWTITSSPAMTLGNYTTTLFNTAGTYTNSVGATNWTVMKDDGSGWALTGTCSGSTVNQVVRTGMSGFSNFGSAQSATVLDIQLTSFTGAVVSSGNWLQWTTASELNNNYFIVEKSPDAMEFSELLKVNGAGTSKEQHTYEGYDFNPLNGINYYRLKQVDFDGHSTYSDLIALRNYSQSEIVTSINPNPTTGDVQIEVMMPVDAVVKIEVRNIFGTVLNSLSSDVKEGLNVIPAAVNAKEGGIYLLRIICDDVGYSYQAKVVKY